MKRLITFLLVTCVLISACGLFACDGGQTPPPTHEHSFSQQWTKDENYHWHDCQAVDCDEKADKQAHEWTGEGTLTCTVCGATKQDPQTPPVHEHSYGKEWTTDQENHWKKCSGCEETAELGAHEWTGEGTLTCTVCGATKQDDFSGEVSEEQWNLATIAEKFNNVTIKYEFIQNQMGLVKSEMWVDGDKVLKKNADPVMNIGYTGEQGKAQKDLVLNLFLGLIEKYENFTYNAEDGTYASTETISTTVTDDVTGYTANETLTNGKVKFASDYTIEWLTCDMTEEISVNGQLVHAKTYEDMLFTFTNFGTTIVDFVTEVPYIPQNTYTQVTEEQWKASMRIEYDCEIKQTLTMLANGEFYYVMEDGYIRSGNVIKFSDWYISIEGDKYFEYNSNSKGEWSSVEIEEDDYIKLATFAELIDAYDKATFDAETGLYICDKLELDGGYTTYYNIKIGFVDGKVAYVYYEDETDDGMKPVYQCYFDYKTIEVTLPNV